MVKWAWSIIARVYNTMHVCMMVATEQFLVEYSKSGGGFQGTCSSSSALCECARIQADGLVYSTSAAPQSIWCRCPHACFAIAGAFVFPPLIVNHHHSVLIPLMKTPEEVSKRWDKI